MLGSVDQMSQQSTLDDLVSLGNFQHPNLQSTIPNLIHLRSCNKKQLTRGGLGHARLPINACLDMHFHLHGADGHEHVTFAHLRGEVGCDVM